MKLRSLLILSSLVILFASCGNKGGNSGLMIPKDAAVVVHINTPSLSSKLSWDEIRQSDWFNTMHKEMPDHDTLAQQLMANPASSGVDIKKDMIFYVKKHGAGSYAIFAGALTDAVAFEKLCKQIHAEVEVKKDGGFNYINIKEEGALVWNTSHFVYASNADQPNMGSMMKGNFRSRNESRQGFGADSLRILGEEALAVKSSDNLDTDDRFASLLKDSNDIHIWFNVEQYAGAGMNTGMPMIKTDAFLKDNAAAISINFDNGKITAKMKHYAGSELSNIRSNNKPEKVSADVINRIPSSDVVAVLAFNYSPKGLKEILKMTGLDIMADMFLAKANFSIDDFAKANKGEVLVALTDPTTKREPDTSHQKGRMGMMPHLKTDMKVLFATSVNDKASFDKMVTMAWDMSKQFMGGDEGDNKGGKPGINYKLENNWFAVSNSEEYRDKFLAGGNSNLPFVSKITGHPMGLYIDLQKLMHSVGTSFGPADTADTNGLNNAVNMWENIVATGGDYKDKAIEYNFEINLIDKNTNSLKQMNQYFDKVATMRKERMEKWKGTVIDHVKDIPVVVPKKNKKK